MVGGRIIDWFNRLVIRFNWLVCRSRRVVRIRLISWSRRMVRCRLISWFNRLISWFYRLISWGRRVVRVRPIFWFIRLVNRFTGLIDWHRFSINWGRRLMWSMVGKRLSNCYCS